MAVFEMTFMSYALQRVVPVHMILPNDLSMEMMSGNLHYERPPKTLFLLHGFSGSGLDWITESSVRQLAWKYNLAIILPSGENSFYLNQKGIGGGYQEYIGIELVEYMRRTFGLAKRPEDTYIGGMSMGGFGALHTGLKFPENFSKMFGLSSAMIVNRVKKMKPGFTDMIGDYEYYTRVFGNSRELENNENNPEYLVKERKRAGEKIQPILMVCGSGDFLVEDNREFRDFLKKEEVEVTYWERAGIHDWNFWNKYLEPAIMWLLT